MSKQRQQPTDDRDIFDKALDNFDPTILPLVGAVLGAGGGRLAYKLRGKIGGLTGGIIGAGVGATAGYHLKNAKDERAKRAKQRSRK